MPLNRIFDTAPKSFGQDDIVGNLRSGLQIDGKPVALQEWRVTTGDPEVAQVISDLYGGKVENWETKSEQNLQVLTEAASIHVQLLTIQSNFALWGRANTPIRVCDGMNQRDDSSSPCVCPSDIKEHKEAARAGTACQPNIRATLRLTDNPDLGIFRYSSGSWQLAKEIGAIEIEVNESDEPREATLGLELVEWTTKTGQNRAFTKPVIKLL